MRNWLCAVLLVMLLACSQNVEVAEPFVDSQVANPILDLAPLNLCANITCPSTQICQRWELCMCTRQKLCGDKCIPDAACCADSECPSQEQCVGNKCVYSCAGVSCEANKVCDEDFKGCTCPVNYRFCETQSNASCRPLLRFL